MNTLSKVAAPALVLAILVAPAAHAQAPAPGSPAYESPSGTQDAPPDPVAYARQNLASLRARLALTPAQAPAWNAFVDAVLDQARDSQAQMAQMAQMAQGPAAAPDRLARMAQFMRHGADGTARMAQALRPLYAQLDPRQRSTIDQEFARGPAGDSMPPPTTAR